MAWNPNFRLVRADDQLVVDVQVLGLEPVAHQPPNPTGPSRDLALIDDDTAGRLWLRFPPQQILEYAADSEGDRLAQERPIFAPPTDVVVEVPAGSSPFPLTIPGLLDAVRRFPVVTDGSAGDLDVDALPVPDRRPALEVMAETLVRRRGPAGRVDGRDRRADDRRRRAALNAGAVRSRQRARTGSQPAAAATPPTGFALPYRLVINPPGGDTRFDHAVVPVDNAGRVGLWHTTLAARAGDDVVDTTFGVTIDAPPFQFPATAVSDAKLVNTLTSDHCDFIAELATFDEPAKVHRLALSTLGATLDLRGDWPASNDVRLLRHRVAMGRDQLQRIVTVGRLYPFRQLALMTSETAREIEKGTSRAAALHTTATIAVLEPVTDFTNGDGTTAPTWPFRTVEIDLDVTPPGTPRQVGAGKVPGAQVLDVRNRPFLFPCRAIDLDGQLVTFTMPMIFVPGAGVDDADLPGVWREQGDDFTVIDAGGQTFALAPSDDPGGRRRSGTSPSALATSVIANRVHLAIDTATKRPVVHPEFGITGIVPAIDHLAPGVERTVRYAGAYADHRFDEALNQGQVLLELVKDAGEEIVAGLADEATGGLAQLDLPINGVSREFGAVAGTLSEAVNGSLDLTSILDPDLKLLGVVPLIDLFPIKPDDVIAKLPMKDAYRLVTDVQDGVTTQDLTFQSRLFGDEDSDLFVGNGLFRLQPLRPFDDPDADNEAFLTLHQHTEIEPEATPPVRSRSECTVDKVELEVRFDDEPVVTVQFEKISFTSVDGKKPDIHVDMGELRFGGILGFVARLAELVDKHGFSDPPALAVGEDSIRSSFSFPVPSIAIGMFALENISFGAELAIFFNGDPLTLSFDFATHDNPFRLSVAALSGGGHLRLGFSTDGLNLIDGMLEFGASLSLDLVVASASVEAMGGVSFRYRRTPAGETGDLSAFFRVHGELDVLSLIMIAVDLTLILEYQFAGPDKGKLVGRAELAVEVKLVFFSETVVVPFEQKFAGSNGDPTFAELMAPDDWVGRLPWETYCAAFTEV
jgi:hypothetical protein